MTHYELVGQNRWNSFFILTIFSAFVIGVVAVLMYNLGYGLDMVGLALIVSGFSTFLTYWFSDKIILGISGARPASRKEFFDFYTVTENICIGQRLPVPKLYVIEDTAMNAFATGRDPEHAVVCATTGLLTRLDRAEIEGVVAHELSHVQNYDIRLMSVVAVMVGLVALLSDWFLRMGSRVGGRKKEGGQAGAVLFILGIVLAILSPLIAQMVQLAISRRREYLADASGVAMTKNPSGLASALEKLSQDKEPLEAANKATAHLYIADPLRVVHGGIGWFAGLFATHPPIQDRIKILKGM